MFNSLLLRSYSGILLAVLSGMAISNYLLEDQYHQFETYALSQNSQGIYFLLSNQLAVTEKSQWEAAVSEWTKNLPYHIRLVSLNTLAVDSKKRQQLKNGEPITLDADDEPSVIYPLALEDQGLSFSHADEKASHNWIDTLDYTRFFIAFLAVAIAIFWIQRSVIRHIKDLSKAVEKFGLGSLDYRANESVPAPVGQLAASFNTMANHIETLIKEREVMTGAIAHELRTPITRLRFALDMTQSFEDKEVIYKSLKKMDRDLDELNDLVSDILTLSRVNSTNIEQNIAPFDPHSLVNNVIEELAIFSPSLEIQSFCDFLKPIQGSLRDLTIALRNLVTNAQRNAKSTIHITISLSDEHDVRIAVDDDGPGIPLDQREFVKLPFSRLDNSRTRKTGGCGLGLAIVDLILKGHNGALIINKSPLGGARLEMQWPSPIKEH